MTVCDVAGIQCCDPFETLTYSDYDFLYEEEGVCGCLDDCNSISYDIEFVYVKFNQNHSSRSVEKRKCSQDDKNSVSA
jgi:hypothetical protein